MDHEEREEREALLQRVSSNTIASSTLDTCPIELSNQSLFHMNSICCMQVHDMYFAKPPISPDLGFYKEVFQALIKYNDRLVGRTT